MENELIAIGQHQIPMKVYEGKPVVTFKEIDECHERPEGTARKRFNDNKRHFVEGTDFFQLNQPSEIRTLGIQRPQGGTPANVVLITKSGYLMLVKSFTDDLAWDVQRALVNNYFEHKQEIGDTSDMVSLEYVNQQIESLRQEFRRGLNSVHNAFIGVQKALPTTQAVPKNTMYQTVSFGDEEWKAKQFATMKSLIKERPEYKKVNVVLRKVYAKMRNVYGIVFEQEYKDYCERHNTSGHISTIEVVSDKEMLRSLFSSILADMFNHTVITPEHRQAMVNTVVDPVRETIKPLIEKYHDISKGGNNTFRKVYSAMDVSWNMRKSRYRNSHNLKNYPSKMTIVKNNPKLLKMFCDTVNQMLAE